MIMKENSLIFHIITKLLILILWLSTLILGGILCIQPISASTIQDVFMNDAVSGRVLDVVLKEYPQITPEQMQSISNVCNSNPEIQSIVSDYLDYYAKKSTDSTVSVPDSKDAFLSVNQDFLNALEQETGKKLTKDQQENLIQQFEEKETQVIQQLNDMPSQLESFSPEAMSLLKVYNIISSKTIFTVVVILVIMSGMLLIFFQRKNFQWIHPVSISFILNAGMIGIFLPTIIKLGAGVFTNQVLGRTSNINMEICFYIGKILLVVGILLQIVRFLLNRFIIKDK